MLEHLFGSRTRVKLLSLFLRNPDQPLFVREITRRVDTQINAVRRELSNLIRLGLITETTVREDSGPGEKKQPGLKKKYYRINDTFVLLPELSSLVSKAQVLMEKKLDQEIAKLGDVRYLAFMGFFLGKTTHTPVDLFIVGRVDKKPLQELLWHVEKELGFDVNFSCMALDEFQYRRDIADRFLSSIIEAPKHVVIDRLTERKLD